LNSASTQSASSGSDSAYPGDSSGGWTGSYPAYPGVVKPQGTDYDFISGSSGTVANFTVKGASLTSSNTLASGFRMTSLQTKRMFPEVARLSLMSAGEDSNDATLSGFNIPVGFDMSSLKNGEFSMSDHPVILEGTPFRPTPGLNPGDYIASPEPIAISTNSSVSIDPSGRLSPAIWFGGYHCSSWQQNVIVTQFGLGALAATCLDSSSVKSEASVAACIRRMLPRLSTPAGYQSSAWNTNCFVCVNEAVQSFNLWDSSVKDACNDVASPSCPIDILATQFEACSGFDFMEPDLASFCDYSFNRADLFQSMVNTCIGTAQSGSDMMECVKYTIAKSGMTEIDSNCLSSWAYLLEATNRSSGKSECQKDVTSAGCTSGLSTPLSNFAKWAGFDPTLYYYAYPAGANDTEGAGSASVSPFFAVSFAILLSFAAII